MPASDNPVLSSQTVRLYNAESQSHRVTLQHGAPVLDAVAPIPGVVFSAGLDGRILRYVGARSSEGPGPDAIHACPAPPTRASPRLLTSLASPLPGTTA